MPDRVPDKRLGEYLEEIEGRFDRLDRSQAQRNRWLAAICSLVAVLLVVVVALWVKVDAAEEARIARGIDNCAQDNRTNREFLFGLAIAFGDGITPEVRAGAELLPRRQCTEQGNRDYYEHAPKEAPCKGDGKGFCLPPTTTTTSTPG